MSDIYFRAFSDNKTEFKHNEPENHSKYIRLIIDAETMIDQYQNLNFGSCLIQNKISTGIKEKWYLFYGNIPEDKIQIIKDYGKENNIDVLQVRELSRYLSGKVKSLEFKIPDITMLRIDTSDIKDKIMSIDAEEKKALKINKSTLWYQQKKIKKGKSIKLYN